MPRAAAISPSPSHSSLDPSSSLSSLDPAAAPLVSIAEPAAKAHPPPSRRVTLSILESVRFSRLSKELHSSSRALVRSQSSASKSSFSTRTGTSTRGSRVSQSDYENHRDGPVDDLDLDDDLSEQDQSEMSRSVGTSEPPSERTSAKAKIYEFFSRTSSRSRSRSKSTVDTDLSHPPTPPPVPPPDPSPPHASSSSASRPSRSHVAHISTSTPFNPSKPATRSPSRPLSNTTATTGTGNDTDKTITPSTPRPRRNRPPHAHPGHFPAASMPPPQYESPYIDLDVSFSADQNRPPQTNGNAAMPSHANNYRRPDYGYQYDYDPRMPPPPVPMPVPVPATIPAPAKERRKTPKLFGISLPGRGRSRARDAENLGFGRAATDEWGIPRLFSAPANLSPERHDQLPPNPIFAPQPRTAIPTVTPSMPFSHAAPAPGPAYADLPPRSRSSPPASPSERDERCSPLFGLASLPRLFGSRAASRDRSQSHSRTRSKGKEKEKEREKQRTTPLVVSVPMLRTRTHSKDGRGNGPGRHGSFDFERPPLSGHAHAPALALQRSASLTQGAAGPRGVRHPHPAASAATHARGGTHPPQKHVHGAHGRSQSRARGYPSPHSQPHSPLMAHATGASANSQSTGTATGTTAAGGGDGSWGRKAGWLRAGVLPPFAFEPAVSGEGSGRASPVSEGRGREARAKVREVGGRDDRRVERGWDRDRDREVRKGKEREREGRDRKVEGRWEEREVDLGLGLAWAPSKIKVREWTGRPSEEGVMEKAWEREGERRARAREREREKGWERERERTYPYEGTVRRERDVTERFRDVLGADGFDKFRRYVRRYDDNQIHLEGPNGLLARVRLLLDSAPYPRPSERHKRQLLDDLVRIVNENDF